MSTNWYIALDLEFAPNPVNDEKVIEDRIKEKKEFWSRNANDMKNGSVYKNYIKDIPQIKRDMIGEANIREALIKDACKQVYEALDERLRMFRLSGISNEAVEKIAKKNKVNPEVVKLRAEALGIKIDTSDNNGYTEIYNKYYKDKPKGAAAFKGIDSDLEAFSKIKSVKIKNLYEFLYMDTSIKNAANQPCETLREKAKDKRKEFYKNDSESATGKKLCSGCEITFKDEKSKETYDKYLEYRLRKAVLDDVKEVNDLKNEIDTENYNDYVAKLTELFKDRKLAEKVLIAFCKVENIQLPLNQLKEIDNNSKVCRCGCINDISDGRKVCKNCGLELQISCPKCKAINDSNIKVCKCGFKFENIDKAAALCELAESSIELMDLSIAEIHLKDAEKYWPGTNKVKELFKKLNDVKVRAQEPISKMRNACADKKYYEAQKQLLYIKKLFPYFEDKELEIEINNAVNSAEEYKNKAQNSYKEQEVIEACTKAYEACIDYPGIMAIISKLPPKQPSNLVITQQNNMNVITWSRSISEGLVYYHVIRKEGAVPTNAYDGELIGKVSMCSINDIKVEPGKMYYYAVFAERAGVFSNAAVTENYVASLFELSNITVFSDDKILKFKWDKVENDKKVVIYRTDDRGRVEKFESNNNQQFIDKNVVNDKSYTYRLCLAYVVGGQTQITDGIVVTATPTKPPKPIDKLSIQQIADDDFELSWEGDSDSEVQFYYSEEKPEYLYNDMISIQALERKMKSLTVKRTAEGKGEFKYTGDNKYIYVLGVVVKGGALVIGHTVRVCKGEKVNIKSVSISNEKIYISIDPPKNASGFLVLFRNDQYPIDLDDMKSTRKFISLKQYEYDSALVIESNKSGEYYFSIFAQCESDGEKKYSVGSDYMFSNLSKQVINYSINVTKKLLGANILTLEFDSEEKQFRLPDIDIVSAVGNVPMFKNSAELFYAISEQEVTGSLKIKIPLKRDMPKGTCIKAFLKNSSMQNIYQLKVKLGSEFKIS